MKLGRHESLLWGACFTLAVCVHGAGAAALLVKWSESSDLVAGSPVVMIDLAPVAAAPETTPNDAPPDQVAARAEEPEPEPEPIKPIEKVELSPPDAKPDVVLPPPPPKVIEKPKEKKKSIARAPSAAPEHADHAAAPKLGSSSRESNASWRSQLVARLERYKRYPSEARGDAGVTQVAFRVDRSGGVHGVRIARSSGSSLLDRETLALVDRAQPMPAPPSDISDAELSVIAPVRYNSR
jgi:protein TonB